MFALARADEHVVLYGFADLVDTDDTAAPGRARQAVHEIVQSIGEGDRE